MRLAPGVQPSVKQVMDMARHFLVNGKHRPRYSFAVSFPYFAAGVVVIAVAYTTTGKATVAYHAISAAIMWLLGMTALLSCRFRYWSAMQLPQRRWRRLWDAMECTDALWVHGPESVLEKCLQHALQKGHSIRPDDPREAIVLCDVNHNLYAAFKMRRQVSDSVTVEAWCIAAFFGREWIAMDGVYVGDQHRLLMETGFRVC